MSQKKVDKYKEYKKNKSQILKREKMVKRLEFGMIGVICALFLAWFVVSIGMNINRVDKAETEDTVVTTEVDMNAYGEYISALKTAYTE
ncbi:MAG: hypothetical protein Q4B09_05680 [Lachnospiraceae bacterium]|nr:hypothetical protein [Lachnospiraceae bacterium]